MAIAFDATPLCRNISGVGRYTYNLIKAYATDNPQTTIYLLCFIDDTLNSAYSLPSDNVRIFRIPLPRKVYQFTYRKLFRPSCDRFLKRLSLKAVICTNFVIFPYVKNIPSIIVIHDLAYIRFPDTIERKNLSYLTKHIPKSLKEATVVAAVSDFTKSELHDVFGISKKSIRIINCGINSSEFGHGLKKRDGAILAVGTQEPRKNLQGLLDAYYLLPKSVRQKHTLKIVGATGWGSLQSLKGDDGSVEFLGYIPDSALRRLYGTCSFLVFPSLYEGFGLPLLEAFSSNTPIICSNIPPFREIAKNNALYFEPSDVDDIARKVASALSGDVPPPPSPGALRRWGWGKASRQLSHTLSTLSDD